MANEFKIKKGLIVAGASGGTAVDVQGSQGQLFSVTDDLSGSIFAVSDISGVPILDVNSSGAVNIDGTLIGSSTAYFSGAITTNLSSEGTYFTGGSGAIRQLSITSGTNTSAHALHTFNIASSNGKYEFDINGTTELSLVSSNATFVGDVTAPTFLGDLNGTINTATTGVTQTSGNNSTLIATTAYADAAAAAVPIGDYLPLAGGTLTGGLIGTSANFGEGVKSTDGFFNNVEGIRLLYPNGGSNNALGNSGTTGALKITLPQGWTSTMMRMAIKVYEYSESKSFTINCGGYNHSDSSAWINEFAYIESQSEVDRNFTVRFGYDSNNKCCIYIGELTSVWSYPKVFVTDFEAGFNNTVASNWQDGWVISMETTAFENVSQIRTNCQINNWKRNGQDVYYGSGTGNVGIGTTSPGVKLDVEAGNTGNVQGDSTTAAIFRAGRQNVWFQNQRTAAGTDWNNNTFKIIANIDSTSHQSINFVNDASYNEHIDIYTGNQVFNTRFNANGNVGIGTTSPAAKLEVNGALFVGNHTGTVTPTDGIWIEGADGDETQIQMYSLNGSVFHVKNAATKATIGYSSGQDRSVNFTNSGAGDISVGIGTTSPENKLHVQQSALYTGIQTTAGIRVKSDGGSAIGNYHGTIALSRGTGSVAISAVQEATDSDVMGMAFFTHPSTTGGDAAVEQMRIDQNGNVGIGTTSPSAKLHLSGISQTGSENVFKIENDTSNTKFQIRSISGDYNLQFKNAGNVTRVFLDSNGNSYFNGGNVGIGTTSPDWKLHLNSSAELTPTYQKFTNGTATTGTVLGIDSDGDFIINNGEAKEIKLYTNDSQRVTIQSGGNVGIGTTSPQQKLHVNDGGIRVEKFGTGLGGFVSVGNATEQAGNYSAYFFGNTASDSNYFKGGIAYETLASTYGRGDMHFLQNSTTSNGIANISDSVMTILNGGNVGIGTTSPGAKLDVQGTQGQLFSVTDDLSGDIFSVADISGVPIMNVNSNGTSYFDGEVDIKTSFGGSNFYQLGVGTTSSGSIYAEGRIFCGGTTFTNGEAIFNDKVGIGTTSPSDKLHVNGTVRSQAPATSDWALLGYNSAGSSSSGLWFENGSGDILLRRSDNSLQTRIRSAGSSYINGGSLGLGTTSPAQKLTVNSGRMLVSNTTTPIYIKAGSTYKSWVHHIGGSDGYIFAPSTADNGETWDWANQTKLGANGVVTAKNFQLSSDERFKNNIKDIKDIKVEAAFKSFEMESSPGEKRYGVVAQELEKTNPELVETDHEGFKSVKYIDLLIAKIAELEARLEKLEK